MIRSICILSVGYPTPTDPYFAFVEQIAVALSNKGIRVFVISPQSIIKHWFRGKELHPKYRHYNFTESHPGIFVYQPCIISFGNHLEKISNYLRNRAIAKSFKALPVIPDVCYGHFWHAAKWLYPHAKNNNRPLFVACGESNVITENPYNPEDIRDFLNYVNGVICVSSKNKEESIKAGFTDGSNCMVIPNAVNPKLFYKKDKYVLRERYGYNKKDFIVAFCGAFEHRKGSLRLSHAIDSLTDCDIKSFFIGKGLDYRLENPDCKGILFKGPLGHESLPDYLNMADVFCLPTLQEGCCNAIIEALACGLPVISSDRSFNYDVLNKENSILVDPMDENQIADAIRRLYEDIALRKELSKGALDSGKMLTIDKRADKVISFIENRI